MICYVLLHYFEVVGVYSSQVLAEHGKTDSHVAAFDPKGWYIQEWELDKFLDATRAALPLQDIPGQAVLPLWAYRGMLQPTDYIAVSGTGGS